MTNLKEIPDSELLAEVSRREEEARAAKDALLAKTKAEAEENRKVGYKLIAEKTEAARKLIKEAEEIANNTGCSFIFSVAYGMGGSYYPKPTGNPIVDADGDHRYDEEHGWVSSSANC